MTHASEIAKEACSWLSVPPLNPLRTIFTEAVLNGWATHPSPSQLLLDRKEVITACGPYPSNPDAAWHLRVLRARKAAWEAYLCAAFACGLFEGNEGKDLRNRLTGIDDDNFRSAMAECLACWFFAGRLGLRVRSRPIGRRGPLELAVELPDGEMNVEVKSPHRERPTKTWVGDDSDILARCLDEAQRQFSSEERNVLFIVPDLKTSVFQFRYQLTKAFFGQEKITIPINLDTGGPTGEPELTFYPEGKFLNRERPGGKPLKSNGMPAFTRVSAVFCVEEWLRQTSPQTVWVDHRVLVLHNPFSKPIPQNIWKASAQFIPQEDIMTWDDGHGMFP